MLQTDRLISLRKSKGLFQKDLASEMGLERSTYVKYENNGIQPPNDTIVKLAEFFNVTTDYLLGKSNDSAPPDKNKPLTNRQAAELLQQKLAGTSLVDKDGVLSEEGAEVISRFIIANEDMLKELLGKE